MRTVTRNLLRLTALSCLAIVVLGVPIVVAVTIGVPMPSLTQWRSIWRTHRVDTDVVVRLGAAVFVMLWAWFATTALAELARVLSRRRPPSAATLVPSVEAPADWVRWLVRFIAVSSVAASAAACAVSVSGGHWRVAHHPTQVADAPIAPGEPVVVVDRDPVTAPSEPAVAASLISSGRSSIFDGLGVALVLSAGALGALDFRRRRRLRSASTGASLAPPTLLQARTEMMLRASSAGERLARLDLALRSAARDLALQHATVVAAVLSDVGDVRLFVRGTATPADSLWRLDEAEGTWLLAGSVPIADLAARARDTRQPCPALVHLGMLADGGELFLDLEAAGVLAVSSPDATAVIRTIAASLAVSPFLDQGRVLTVGLGEIGVGDREVQAAPTLDAALDRLTVASAGIAASTHDVTTFALRAAAVCGEAWEPTILVASGVEPDESTLERLSNVGSGRGAAIVVQSASEVVPYRVHLDQGRHLIEPFGLELTPVGVRTSEVDAVADLLSAADLPAERHAEVVPIARRSPAVTYAEPQWQFMVRLLGQVEVVSAEGVSVTFERSKSLELVVWLTQHRERPTRAKARSALWELQVRDATFANVVSEARRSMARVMPPEHGEEWIGRTMTENLPLGAQVVTDADLLSSRVVAARGLLPIDAVEVLRPGLELVGGLPFEGTSFLWTDAEGLTSSLVLLATGAAIELASHYLALGDIEGVFWATGQGLKVLSGHEELIALRMRAHAVRGDRAGVRHEWESYERALANDPWASAEPAPKLVLLRRQLLSSGPLALAGTEAAGA